MTELDFRQSLGAYLLGALEPSERAEVEIHLTTCELCSKELASLASLPGLLSRLDAVDIERSMIAEIESGPELLDRILSELARRRGTGRRRQRYLAAAAAAALILIGGGGYAVVNHFGSSPSVATGHTISATNASSGVHATVGLLAKPWGTSITLNLGGVPRGTHCQLVVTDTAGNRYVAGSWEASYDGTASITGAVDIQPSMFKALDIESTQGARLLDLPV